MPSTRLSARSSSIWSVGREKPAVESRRLKRYRWPGWPIDRRRFAGLRKVKVVPANIGRSLTPSEEATRSQTRPSAATCLYTSSCSMGPAPVTETRARLASFGTTLRSPFGCCRRSKSPGIVSRQQDFAESEKRADRARFGPRCGVFGDSGPRGTTGRFVIRPNRYLQRGLGMTAEPMPNSMRPASQTLVPKPTPSAASCIWSVTAKARKP
jgi:hypothetical protein